MMTKLCIKLLSGMLALMLFFGFFTVATAEETLLKVTLTGIYPAADGTQTTIPVSGAFDVYQAEAYVGRLEVTPEGDNTMLLPGAGSVRIAPVAGSYPAELSLNAYGYAVSIEAGRLNIAPLSAYAEVQAPEVVPEATQAPTATPVTTEAPTATPAPTEAPTATPVPTEATTATPAPGALTLRAEGDDVTVSCTVDADDAANVAKGSLSIHNEAYIGGLREGTYHVTVHLPDNVVLTSLNGKELAQRGTVRWNAPVQSGHTSTYTLGLTRTGNVHVIFSQVEGASVMLRNAQADDALKQNPSLSFFGDEMIRYDVYQGKNVLPGSYEVVVTLPEGRYEFEDACWTVTEQADGTLTAVAPVTVKSGKTAELPAIIRQLEGDVSGTVRDAKGKVLAGALVSVSDANGRTVASATTDQSGAWSITGLAYGTYSAGYEAEGTAIAASAFTLSAENDKAVLSASAAKPAKITVRAFVDENNNGTSGKGENFVRGVEVSLITADGAVAASDVTDRDGYATIQAPEGEYILQAVAPEDYGFGKKGDELRTTHSIMTETGSRTQQSGMINLKADDTLEVGIGLQRTAIVRGTVWNDLNADGLWQEEEPGIAGVRLTLEGTRNKDQHEIVTDENGVYEFHQVRNGSYRLTCHVPDKYVFTVKAKGDLEAISRMTTEADRAGEDTFTLERGEEYADHNIGMMEGAIIEGRCFLDANSNGVYDAGELPLQGVEMRLARQSNNVLLQKVFSDENGVYRFVGQRGSTFTLRATLPRGYRFTVAGMGENANQFAPNSDKNERKLTDITIDNGGYASFVLGAVQYGFISGKVYYDANFSGAWETGEKAATSHYITLLDAQGNKLTTQKTDKNGSFTFSNVTPGQYMLHLEPKAGYAFTALGGGNVMKTLPDGSGRSDLFTVGMGQQLTGASAGMIVPAIIKGTIFADDNDNGLMERDEKGLAGAVVRLMGDKGEAFSAVVDASGAYVFNAVLPGTYYLQYELPAGGLFAVVKQGGNAIDEAGCSETFTVQSGDRVEAPLCGGILLSDISGVSFADRNGNATWDADEALLSGMTITLLPAREGGEALTVVTGADGRFAIEALRPGDYTLTLTCPDVCVLSRLDGVSLGLRHGLNTQTVQLRLPMGVQWHDQMLGCVLPSDWTGEAYLDENYDGVRGADEAPAVGETLVLIDAETGEVVSAVQTDDHGVFVIKGIAPGEYELTYPLDDGNLEPRDPHTSFSFNGHAMTTGPVRVNENEDMSGTVLSVVRTTEIAGTVWLEEYDGVTTVAGAKIRLLDSDGAVLAENTTDADGRYSFKGLMPADYAIDAVIPAGYVLVESSDPHLAEAGLCSVIEDAEGLYGRSLVISLRMAKHRRDMDVGVVLPGRLGDKVWLDLNGNGLQDGEEGGIPGVTIELLRGDKVVAAVVSDQYGYFVFENLYPTQYILRAVWPAEVQPTVQRSEGWPTVSVLQKDGLSIPVTVESNKANYAADLGFVLVEADQFPAGYGEGEKQNWKK